MTGALCADMQSPTTQPQQMILQSTSHRMMSTRNRDTPEIDQHKELQEPFLSITRPKWKVERGIIYFSLNRNWNFEAIQNPFNFLSTVSYLFENKNLNTSSLSELFVLPLL